MDEEEAKEILVQIADVQQSIAITLGATGHKLATFLEFDGITTGLALAILHPEWATAVWFALPERLLEESRVGTDAFMRLFPIPLRAR